MVDVSVGVFPNLQAVTSFCRQRTHMTLALLRLFAAGKDRLTSVDFTVGLDRIEACEDILVQVSRIDHALLPCRLRHFWHAIMLGCNSQDVVFDLEKTLIAACSPSSLCYAGDDITI
jgi:hypothetical protein